MIGNYKLNTKYYQIMALVFIYLEFAIIMWFWAAGSLFANLYNVLRF